MVAPPILPCLLMWMLALFVSRAHGEVTAPDSLNAIAGQPFALSCNITVATGDQVRQVRWLNRLGQVLIAYQPGAPVQISVSQPGVALTAHHSGGSAITVTTAQPGDQGCYRCVFDVYPSGQQQARTCLTLIGAVMLEGNTTALRGRDAVLACRYSLPAHVRQVLWRKRAEQGHAAGVASYSGPGPPRVEQPFLGRAALSSSLGETRLTLQDVGPQDEGCYTCEFHAFPEGTRSATACLSVYVLPEPKVSFVTWPSGVVEANCTARSRPAARITWSMAEENRTMGPPALSFDQQGDGTTLVTSTLHVQSERLNQLSIKCVVHHQGLDRPLSLALSAGSGVLLIVLLTGLAVIICISTCIFICWCFFRKHN